MRNRPRRAHWALAIIAIMIASNAFATVTQVDGTILPVNNAGANCDGVAADNLQACFDLYEGVALPNPNAIDQTLDAAQVPEIFMPNTAMPVSFRDIAEGAGFENSFGWYNVGDDVTSAAGIAANLHPILGCGVPMAAVGNATTHTGNPAFYVVNSDPNGATFTATVDFAMEQTALRYKGGFIGFYLITPEGNPSANNCGDFKNGSDALSLLGRIYYTQRDLNNDGDFVHHLVYGSKLVANRFYFGFEDLFRGGDNDFEDMMILSVGLTPPCVPQAEVCDGLDNDCDMLVDGNDPDLTGVANPCSCDGVALVCDNGPKFGTCRTGVTQCTAGAITCHGTGVGTSEICDGLDNNCDNMVDNNPSGTGAACDGSDSDLCPEGNIVCITGMLQCNDNTPGNIEICDAIDNNCNGTNNEGNPGGGGSCGSGIGVCTPGVLTCTGNSLMCIGGNAGSGELCNGLDDDCDGVIDDSPGGLGLQCGATSVGECSFGSTICSSGTVQCAGEVGPATEVCNTLDDDCDGTPDDNPVDAGQPCGSSIGACNPGAFVCTAGGLVCTGGIGPTAEACNAIDDDCDGKVDEMVPGEGLTCGAGMGPCSGGLTKCINGAMECVGGTSGGTETCNLIDDDCDGTVDEGDLCNGGICDNGSCASPCLAGEFPCPQGKKCVAMFCVADPCFGVTCPAGPNGELQSCNNSVCSPVCPNIVCPGALVCRGVDGVCVPNTCEYLSLCNANELCINSQCTSDPCAAVTCPSDQFCREGGCVASCQGVQCGQTQVCKDGVCTATGCAVDCKNAYCDPMTGMCVDDPCNGVQCPPLQVCDPTQAACIPDPCQGITCPGGQVCDFGQCGVGVSGELVTTGGGGGCNSSGGEGALGLVLVIGAFVLRRRRAAVLAVAIAAAVPACDVNEYCLACALAPGDGGNNGDGGDVDAPDAGGLTCDPNQIRPETCNGADDDCDTLIDETIDKQNDEMNCGACGIQCNKPGAQTTCQAGGCGITGCFPGFNDRNGDITGPYAASDGCEYMCFQSNAGVEACDGLDNDCDGPVDETFMLTNDEMNCGACGRVCDFFQATATCTLSTCMFNPATDCMPGYTDANNMQADGCEYQCSPTNGGVEACDVLDNDCDGRVDETFNLTNDTNNCGRCGFVCQFPHATASCAASMCTYNPATDCQAGFVDVNGVRLDGCEYACTVTGGGVETCDGNDNDCDGIADDNPTGTGVACASTTPPTGACVANGTRICSAGVLICSGATDPVAETCNNIDQDCDGMIDDGVSQSCYTGVPASTSGVGRCVPGTATCAAGAFGACVGQFTPIAELCNNLDDDCNSVIDNGPGGLPITQSCYGGLPASTAGVGTCRAGTQTCTIGAFGSCVGEIRPRAEVCGDALDTDCDALTDAAEGCLAEDPELRIDEAVAGTEHSYDVVLARGTGGNVYAAWSQRVGAITEVYFRRSADGGATWSAIVNVTSGVAETAVKPLIAVQPVAAATDRVVVAYQTVTGGVRDIRVSFSSNSGGAFTNSTTATLDSSGDSFHHAVAIRNLEVVVAWERLNTATLIRDVMSATSTDGGANFATNLQVNVNSPASRFAGRPAVAFTSTGRVVYVWREQRGARATRDIFATSVTLAGATPAADILIDGDTLDRRDSDFPVLAVAGASAYLVWQDVSTVAGGGSDVMLSRSLDGGATWGTERIIDDPVAEVSSSFTPTLAVDPRTAIATDDVVAIAWEDRRQGTQVFASVSTDGGTTFPTPVRASNNAGGVITGATSVPVIAAAGSGILAVAYQNQLTNQRIHVFVATSIDNGATWTYTHSRLDTGIGSAILPAITATTVGVEPGAVIGWTDFRAGTGVNGDIFVAVSH